MLMLCMEWWAYEIGNLLSGQCGDRWRWRASTRGPVWKHVVSCVSLPGILGVVELGAQSVVYELTVILFLVSVWGLVVGMCWTFPLKEESEECM